MPRDNSDDSASDDKSSKVQGLGSEHVCGVVAKDGKSRYQEIKGMLTGSLQECKDGKWMAPKTLAKS